MKKYYAIKSDDYKNVVESWDECKEIIKDLKAPKYKSFQTIEEANAFLNGEELKQKENEANVSFAIGYSFAKNSKDIEKMLQEADYKMYQDKREYYRK